MASERRTPWFKFYAPDWRSDLSLRECSYAARGLWIDILTVMHEAEPYGHLVISGKPANAKRLSTLLGGTEREVAGLLAQLQEAGVFSVNEAGTIYSRRMIRDAERAAQDKVNGRTGGNPNLRGGVNPKSPHPDNGGVNPSGNPHDNLLDKPTVNGGDKAHSHSQNQKEERDSQRTSEPPRTRPSATPLFPTLSDPPDAWFPHADTVGEDCHGVMRGIVAGHCLDLLAAEVCQAAGINGHARAVDWRPLASWLRDGLDPHERILPVIRRIAARSGYAPPRFLSYFDQAVRDGTTFAGELRHIRMGAR